METHQKAHVLRMPEEWPNLSASSLICTASSRVGASTSTVGPARGSCRGSSTPDYGCATPSQVRRSFQTAVSAPVEHGAAGVVMIAVHREVLKIRQGSAQQQEPAVCPTLRVALMCSMPGSRKPQVLPDPVLAMATRSRPAIATGHACAWMGVGAEKPARLICGGENPRHTRLLECARSASVAPHSCRTSAAGPCLMNTAR